MKKMILITSLFLFFGIAPHVFAEGFVALAPIPGLTDIQYAPNGLAAFFNNLYKFAIGMAAVLAVIMIIWGGLEYATQDSISKKSDGKERIYNAIFGLVLVLSPALVFSIINPSILNLSINLPKLDTASGFPTRATSGALPICGAGQTTGCTKPVCSSARQTNCIPKADALNTVEDYYPTAQAGAVCVELIKPDKPPSNFMPFFCTSTMDRCNPTSTASGAVGGVIRTIGADKIVGGVNGCRQY